MIGGIKKFFLNYLADILAVALVIGVVVAFINLGIIGFGGRIV